MNLPPEAIAAAHYYAMEKLCGTRGLDASEMTCRHTATSCFNAGTTTNNPDISTRFVNNKCLYYYRGIRDTCSKYGLRYYEPPDTAPEGVGTCKHSLSYCTRYGRRYDTESMECTEDAVADAMTHVFGETITRGATAGLLYLENATGIDARAMGYGLTLGGLAIADLIKDPNRFFSSSNPIARTVTGIGCKMGLGGCPNPAPTPEEIYEFVVNYAYNAYDDLQSMEDTPENAEKAVDYVIAMLSMRDGGVIEVKNHWVRPRDNVWDSQLDGLTVELTALANDKFESVSFIDAASFTEVMANAFTTAAANGFASSESASFNSMDSASFTTM
jgi:hypothetical protein